MLFIFESLNESYPFFKIVYFKIFVSEYAAYAIFAEARASYAQVAYYGKGGRKDVAVALELDNHHAVELLALVGGKIVEFQPKVYCQTFGLSVID